MQDLSMFDLKLGFYAQFRPYSQFSRSTFVRVALILKTCLLNVFVLNLFMPLCALGGTCALLEDSLSLGKLRGTEFITNLGDD